jgi:hypothetical protein
MKVTIFKNIKSTSAPFVKDVTYVLDRIKNGKSRETVDAIRFELDKEKRNELKQNLPSICFSGSFSKRSAAGLRDHSGLICLDFDDFPDEETLLAARESLMGDEYVFALFRSPSYTGLKVLVKIPPSKENHKSYFDALATYFDNPYFDKVTSDVSRVCYESYDPELYHNPDSSLWVEGEEVDLEGLGTETPVLALKSENRIIQNLLTWWERKYGRKKGERNSNLFKLAIALHDFGIGRAEAYNTLNQFQETDFPEKEIATIIASAYKNEATFATRFFEDYKTRRDIEKEVINGKSVKQIQKQFPDVENIEIVTEKLKDTIVIDEFWTYDANGKFQVVDHKFKKYIQNRYIFKYFPNKEGDPVFIQITENKVRIITPKQIKDFVLKDLETRPMIGMVPFDSMAEKTKYFTDEYLSFLDTVEVEIKQDTADTAYLYYSDKVLEITKDGVKQIDYIDLDGYVWENQIIPRRFTATNPEEAVYKKYVWLISGQKDAAYSSIKSTIGYLLHGHKTRANNRAVILNDEIISENPNGGSGKGIFAESISHIRRTSKLDGKQFNFEKSFAYQTVPIDTQVLVFDDVKKNFAFENLFSIITEGITIEKKNKDAITIPVQRSPKILITTNYTIGGVGGSHERRKHEIELSAHFGAHHTPLDEFGHMLFDDWDEHEWSRFDNYMVQCIQFYLTHGLLKGDYKNLATRKFIKDTSHEFYEWVLDGNIPKNIRFSNPEKLEELLKEYPDLKKWLTQKRFSMWLETYAEFSGAKYLSGRTNSQRWVMIEDIREEIPQEETETYEPPF